MKIADFGLAVSVPNGLADWFGHAGTLGYMAPEILRRHKYNQSADIFSLGAILFYLLTRTHLFNEPDPEKMKVLNSECNWVYPDNFTPSKSLNDVFEQTLSKESKDRPTASKLLKNVWLQNLMIK